MRFIRWIFGILASISLIIALLLAAIEITAFSDLHFYEAEYAQNQVLDTVGMEMPDLMDVTREMLSYLQGRRDDLTVMTTMFGEQREFFNDREKAHMEDVRNLNLGAVFVMRTCFALSIVLAALLLVLFLRGRDKKPHSLSPFSAFLRCLCRSFQIGAGLFLLTAAIGGLIVSQDFDKYWRMFHTIFFTNDLWLLDPKTDMLINIVPLGFFSDFVLRCVLLFAGAISILLVLSVVYLICIRKKLRAGLSMLLLLSLCGSLLTAKTCCVQAEEAVPSDLEAYLDSIPVSDHWPEAPEISGDAAILIERSTGTVLYAKNALKSEFPASTTKIMTALLTLENGSLTDTVPFSKKAIYALTAGASHIGMTAGETLSVEDCLYGLLLPSANEVANALAEYVSGSMSAFVDRMNQRAAELGCVNTHFVNPNGLHDNLHTTCAYDLAQIFLQCLDTPYFIRIDSTPTYVIGPTNRIEESRPMKTTHKMLLSSDTFYNPSVICGKTGHTDLAGGCLITYAKEGDLELVCVVLHAAQPNEYTDTQSLLDYGFEQFRMADAAAEDSAFFSPQADNGLSGFSSGAVSPVRFLDFAGETRMVLPADTDFSSVTHTLNRSDSGAILDVTYSIDGYTLACAPVKETTDTASFSPAPFRSFGELERMELPKPNYLLIGLFITGFAGAVIAVILAIRSTPERVMKRRQKATKLYKNVNLKKIKIK